MSVFGAASSVALALALAFALISAISVNYSCKVHC